MGNLTQSWHQCLPVETGTVSQPAFPQKLFSRAHHWLFKIQVHSAGFIVSNTNPLNPLFPQCPDEEAKCEGAGTLTRQCSCLCGFLFRYEVPHKLVLILQSQIHGRPPVTAFPQDDLCCCEPTCSQRLPLFPGTLKNLNFLGKEGS